MAASDIFNRGSHGDRERNRVPDVPNTMSPSTGGVGGVGATPLPPPPPLPSPRPSITDAAQGSSGVDIAHEHSMLPTVRNSPSPVFLTVHFTGFEPFDQGSSLFRRWTGDFVAIRSDGEEFSVNVAFLQTDTPHVTGPVVQSALEKLMEYRDCPCRPSKKSVCIKHQEEDKG